ncbi:hypothetical protein [Limisphaera sp. VF-2]|uniref:hypothetical protein n=1 Tax=Limisphaera sp. VF-2 TaxID=3400418 RepID=UPI001760CE24
MRRITEFWKGDLPVPGQRGEGLPVASRGRFFASGLAVLVMTLTHVEATWLVHSNLTLNASLAVQELYDDNVFILDTRPAPGMTGPPGPTVSLPKRESWVTAVTPGLTLQWRPGPGLNLAASYAPEFTWFHRASSEDFVAHRASLNLSGVWEGAKWEWRHQWMGVDGSHWGPVTLRPGDCRAIGGIPLRDRRDAVLYRSQWQATLSLSRGFVRPVAGVYIHDFRTEQLPNPEPNRYLYENYIDRWDAWGGLDLGIPIGAHLHGILGYRHGHQHQGRLRGAPSPYANDYHRFLVGLEGSPVSWLKLAVLAGPDVRDWDQTPPAFHQSEILYWMDATVTVLPTRRDTLVFRATRFEQPAFTSHSVYEDIRYEFSWRHQWTAGFSLTAGLTLYIGDWQAPVQREDWIYTPGLTASYRVNSHLELECSYTHDTAVNRVSTRLAPYAEGREFNRNRLGVTMRYTF